jgi:multiple sugar transport system substrate-binding protein
MLTAGYTPAMHDRIVEKFEEMHYDVDIVIEPAFYVDLYDKIVTAMKAGDAEYDVFLVDNVWTPEFVEAGWIEDITKHISPEIKKEIFPAAWESAEYPIGSGKYYGWPWYIDTMYLLYNKNILSKAGLESPPKTLDELWSQAETIRDKGILKHPIIWSWTQKECLICNYTILTALFGGKLVDKAGKPVFNEGGAVEALEWMDRSIDAGITSWVSLAFEEAHVSHFFGHGEAAFTLAWLSGYEGVNAPDHLNGACGITHVPGSDVLPEGVSVNGAMFHAISSHSRNKSAAIEFVKFWTDLDIQKSFAKWLLPMWIQLFDNPALFREDIGDILHVVKYQYQHMITRPRILKYTVFSKELQRAIHEALTKVKKPQKALDDAAARLDLILEG